MSRRPLVSVAALTGLAVGVLLSGCPRQPGAQAPSGKALKFALVPKSLDNPVFQLANDGAEAAAKELGDVEVVFKAPRESNAAEQKSIVEDLIAQKVDGIAISCNDPAALRPAIDRAMDAGIPTICFDADSPSSKRITYLGIDSPRAGAKIAERLVKALEGKRKGKVAIITGTPGALNLEERIRGVKDYLKQFPDFIIVGPVPCYDDTEKGVAALKKCIADNPDLVGIAMVGGWPLFAEAPGGFAGVPPGKIRVVGFDALPAEWEYVRKGYVDCLVAQRCFGWGQESIRILHDIVVKKQAYPAFVDGGLDIVTRENVDEYARKWETKSF
jgi:ribose transport system substrate-binding protein